MSDMASEQFALSYEIEGVTPTRSHPQLSRANFRNSLSLLILYFNNSFSRVST